MSVIGVAPRRVERSAIARTRANQRLTFDLPISKVGTSPCPNPWVDAGASVLHHDAVDRVIRAMRQRLDEPLSLTEMAKIALFSPFHFDRVFHRVTGSSPMRFLAALRIEAATRLLLTSKLSVTDVCFEVGYSSLGTFSAHFSRVVGISPVGLRRQKSRLEKSTMPYIESLKRRNDEQTGGLTSDQGVSGRLTVPPGFRGLIFIGLFLQPCPSGRPAACALASTSGTFRTSSVADGTYYLLAAACPWPQNFWKLLLPDASTLLVAAANGPVVVESGQVHGVADLVLRPLRDADPPLLTMLPVLLAEYRSRESRLPTIRAG